MSGAFEVNLDELTYEQTRKLDNYLKLLVSKNGSDLHIKTGAKVRGRINGEIEILDESILSHKDGITLAKELLRTRFKDLVEKKNVDFTYKLGDEYRFRVNLFFQVDGVSAVFRTIPIKLPTIESLLLPEKIQELCDKNHRGMILVTGPTGSGKTTTLAAILNRINQTRKAHIITIEDPVEFVYKDDKCVINQRAIGQDALSFGDSLRAALREDPDVILVGEMRDLETIETAIHAAETGHLVFSTLHTMDAKETVGRIISIFPGDQQNRIKMSFASVLKGIISQRLVKTTDGKRRAAIEILEKTDRVREMILEGRDSEIPDAIREGRRSRGTQTFDQHLLDLYVNGIIDKQEAINGSSTPTNLKILMKEHELGQEHIKRKQNGMLDEDIIKSGIIPLKDRK